MDERILKWLYDIKLALAEIDSFFKSTERDFIQYQKNTLLKRAIERELEIIGEAVNRIITRNPLFIEEIQDAKNIIGLRNQVIHAYDSISDENIWAVITYHLPQLRSDVNRLIVNNSTDS